MNKYNPQIHHRRSIRLKGYDYRNPGLYFITICVHNRLCLFGNINVGADPCVCPKGKNGDIHVGADPCVCPKGKNGDIEPIMILNEAGQMVEKWYYKIEEKFLDMRCHEMIVMPNHFHCILENTGNGVDDVSPHQGEHTGSPLHFVVQWFKTMTTNEYIQGVINKNWLPFDGKLWQRDYWEHIIRNEKSYLNLSDYILQNPLKWADDELYNKW